jgi:hypothetical protein
VVYNYVTAEQKKIIYVFNETKLNIAYKCIINRSSTFEMIFFLKYFNKNDLKLRLFSIILIFFFNITVAQTNKNIPHSYREKLQKADEYFASSQYNAAINLYHDVLLKIGKDTAISCKIANSYRMLNDHKNAEGWYRKAIIDNDSVISSIYKLYFAQELTINGKYEEALFWYKEYTKTSVSDIRAIKEIKSIENISKLYKDTTFNIVYSIPVNTQYSELSPHYYKNGILFLSNGEFYNRNTSKLGLLSWYFSTVDLAGNFSNPEKFNKGIKAEYNEGPIAFFDNYKKMIFCQNYPSIGSNKDKTIKTPPQLFYAEQDSTGKWNDIQLLPFNDKNYSYSQPSVSNDGTTLYFSSDVPGGKGGSDIYMSKFENGKWNTPVNLGDKVNTPGDEIFPFIFQDTILYFSSNGLGGLGGFDIFKINLKDTNKIVENLGTPINSANDDFSIIVAKDGLSGYFASNRKNGMGADDIYGFKVMRIPLTIKITDYNKALPVSQAEIYLGDTINEKKIGVTDQDGICTLGVPVGKNFKIRIKKDNYESTIYSAKPVKNSPNTLAVISLNTDSTQLSENTIDFTDENNKTFENPLHVIYKVQIRASRIPVSAKELSQKYSGPLQINNFYEDGWYKYSIGEYSTYAKAKQSLYSCHVYDAFIIAYIDNKKVHIIIAKTTTKETNVKSPVRR